MGNTRVIFVPQGTHDAIQLFKEMLRNYPGPGKYLPPLEEFEDLQATISQRRRCPKSNSKRERNGWNEFQIWTAKGKSEGRLMREENEKCHSMWRSCPIEMGQLNLLD